jgi:hypothetical protein
MATSYGLEETYTLYKKIARWLKDNKLDYGVTFYSTLEWQKRGEKYGDKSMFTIAGECEFFRALNGYYDDNMATYDKFEEFLNSLGYWFEMGYSWSIHIFPKEGGLDGLCECSKSKRKRRR